MTTNDHALRPPIIVEVKAGIYSRPYRLEWDYDNCRWNRFDEAGGRLLSVKDILHVR